MDTVRDMEAEMLELKDEIKKIKMEMELEKQYNRSRNFVISGVPQTNEENTKQLVNDLLSKLGADMKSDLTIHRLGKSRNNRFSQIIVQCPSRDIRDQIVRKVRKARPKVSLVNPQWGEDPIFFNDHLTPYFASLMREARALKALGFKFIWLNGNHICIKKDEQKGSKIYRIQQKSEIDLLKLG